MTWAHPRLYRPFGILRKRRDCLAEDFDVWIEGFPRSANTFAAKSFLAANPGAKVRSHMHLPPFVIHAHHSGKPGMLLLRCPESAALSWAAFWNARIAGCLDYYVDYHRALLSIAPELFIVRFDDAIQHFDKVMHRFNAHFGTAYAPMVHNEQTLANCFAEMDRMQVEWRGFVDEMRVCHPSAKRTTVIEQLRSQLHKSPRLERKLRAANEIYRAILRQVPHPVLQEDKVSTQELPSLS